METSSRLLQHHFLYPLVPEPEPCPVHILYFIRHNSVVPVQLELSTTRCSGMFAVHEWLQDHLKCHVMGNPVTLRFMSLLQPGTIHFLPIDYIMMQVVITV